MAKIRPFDATGWFPIHNAVFDVIMPALSPSAWKVLCVAIRQTWGWSVGATGQERREWDRISYSQFEAKTGLTRKTVASALQECLDGGYLLRHPVGSWRGKPAYTYSLNREYELDVVEEGKNSPKAKATGVNSLPVTGVNSLPVTGREITPTKQKKTNQRDGGGNFSPEDAREALCGIGVAPSTAAQLAAECDPDQVCRWVEYARRGKGIKDPAGLVVARLRAGITAPEPGPREGQPSTKTAVCPGCWRVFPVESVCPDCHRCYDCCACA